MMPSADDAVPTNVQAALLLAALPHLRRLGLPHPSAVAVLEATGAGRSQAYALIPRLLSCLEGLVRPIGRPSLPAAPPLTDTSTLSLAMLDFLVAHPGALTTCSGRRRYSDGYRARVLSLVDEHPELRRQVVAKAAGVPAATLEDWWAERTQLAAPTPEPEPAPRDAVTEARIAAILHLWRSWDGSFTAFADTVRRELDIPWGDTRIGTVLSVYADRSVAQRPGRRPDEKALRDAFQRFFPGAQWTEDGTPLAVTVNGERFTFNLELAVDTCTAAIVGADVAAQETADAVVRAYEDGVTTTGAPPLALNTDNATENTAAALRPPCDQALHVRATPGRPQNDAHVEGAFGLFQSVAPPLVVRAHTPKAFAQALLTLVVTTWARTLNHRPRKGRGGRSRVDLYGDQPPTPEQVAAAREALRALQAEHDQAAQTRRRRADPVARKALDDFFAEREWDDPSGNLRDAIAGYGLDAVLAALATWTATETNGQLPEGAAAQYLLGIARNIQTRSELEAMAHDLWRRRVEAQDALAAALEHERRALRGTAPERLATALERLIRSDSHLARTAWAETAGQIIRQAEPASRDALRTSAITTLAAAHRLPKDVRAALLRAVAADAVPLPA